MNRRTILLTLSALLIAVGIVFVLYSVHREPMPSKCVIELDWPTTTRVVLDDPEQIRTLVLKPMNRARIDKNPARYVIVGTLTLEYRDAPAEEEILLFGSGKYKRGEVYYIADLSELGQALIDSGILSSPGVP